MPDIISSLENALHAWACGNLTAKAVQKIFTSHGWSIDLRQPDQSDELEAIDPTGEYVWLSC